ncbi:pyridoxal 5'-phosphate synthase lyase subunit PdxS [Candidatus Woesearchaeota archaeon]|nr:pyridoxal 5'-phosphate synthase lyase subunit PdxS [Candidatus Woesearchaeota archaeon]
MSKTVGNATGNEITGTFRLKKGLAEMLKNGVIMDVVSAEQAKIAENAGAVAVMALEKVPADIRKEGNVARMADPKKIKEIMKSVTIPVMAKVRIGHFAEAQILESLNVDYIDESEVLTPADNKHIDKHKFKIPFVCGARDLGEALRRINEGAAMIRTKGEAGTGNIIEAVKHINMINEQIKRIKTLSKRELERESLKMRVPYQLVEETRNIQRLPVVNFAAGGVATPADAALMMLLGADGIFVGSGIFKSENPAKTAKGIVEATTHYDNPKIIAKASEGLEAMKGLEIEKLEVKMQTRGF